MCKWENDIGTLFTFFISKQFLRHFSEDLTVPLHVPLYVLNYHTKLCSWTMVFLMYFSNFQKQTHSLGAKNHGDTMVIFDELMTLNTKTLLF